MPPSQPSVNGLPWFLSYRTPIAWYDQTLEDLTRAFNEHDFSALAAWVHDDAVFDWSRSISDNRGVHRGRESMRAAFDDFVATWESVNWTITRVDELGPQTLVVSVRVATTVRGSDSPIEASGAHLLEFDDGLITRVSLFQSRDDAVSAAGETAER